MAFSIPVEKNCRLRPVMTISIKIQKQNRNESDLVPVLFLLLRLSPVVNIQGYIWCIHPQRIIIITHDTRDDGISPWTKVMHIGASKAIPSSRRLI